MNAGNQAAPSTTTRQPGRLIDRVFGMRLYHSPFWVLALILWLSAGCSPAEVTRASLAVRVAADGETIEVEAPPGSTVQAVLEIAGLSLGPLDRVEPPSYTILDQDAQVRLVRVVERFEVEQETVPFSQQRQPTELLPERETRMDPLQPGVNGVHEITYRVVSEDGVEVSRVPIKTEVIQEQKPQIILVGVRPLFTTFPIPGRLVYLVGGNAWMMEGNTANRRSLITTGDLDGRVFSLSADASWLLFTRRSAKEGEINTLWAARIGPDPDSARDIGEELIDLKVANVVHFADWVPGSNNRIAYSTVEPRPAAPGWQAKNDLNYLTIYKSGSGSFSTVELTENIGGSYGWWGINFAWAPDGLHLAYSNSNGIGLVGTTKTESPTPLLKFDPLQTRSDWAWIPWVSWGPDGQTLFTVEHAALPGSPSPEESQTFHLVAVEADRGSRMNLVSDVGMFAYPATSPSQPLPTGELAYQVAYLQAVFPGQSESSPYRLVVMDRDGSNQRVVFPPDGKPGLDPQQVLWSPAPLSTDQAFGLAVLYQGNIWIVEVKSGQIHQVTGDQMVNRIAWRGN